MPCRGRQGVPLAQREVTREPSGSDPGARAFEYTETVRVETRFMCPSCRARGRDAALLPSGGAGARAYER